MSAATTTPGGARAATAHPGPTVGRVVAAEWTKLVSLRSPWWTAAVTVAVAGVLTYLSAEASSGDPGFQPVDSLSTGLALAHLGPLVLGVLVGAGEFRTGASRTTFTLVPRRWPVLAAQVLVMAAFALGTAVLATAASVLGILPAAASRGIAVDLTSGDTPGLVLGMVLFLVALALLGLALGALLRRTVPALVTALLVVLILPVVLMTAGDPLAGGADPASAGLAEAVPSTTVAGTLAVLSPGGAAQLMTTSPSAGPMPGAPDLGPVGGGLVLAAWVLVVLVPAAVRLRTRDVR
ncbi:ABC transporter permease subunit [Cellulomonas telluris]|uniref:ABC transporter permease subunit n=1 Tax=Cellulomonas telluris TaxID=2306636 RepID=UPI0010A94B67|nr:ABC transporter permease subunit [Cellulomonas telluris]